MKQGGALCPIDGDVTRAWFDVLRPRIANGDARLVGVTRGDAMFCLRTLAADMGWKVEGCHEIGGYNEEPTPSVAGWSSRTYAWTLVPRSAT
ncbi:hypothetical protein [Paraburkholderia sp. HP33-1]|uniref:hypothetical protein n=1 Tax=Paraburkholderia sp. HP33-1 TaxID=2883243 RepID=UPI001F3BBDAA|nr:hypothetical protein [Paraburkholderia sp. HP33-1]